MDEFELPYAARAVFYTKAWKIVKQIPAGKVGTYGQIAAMIPAPAGIPEETYLAYRARWVGNAMSNCPAGVPWQRVVNASGKISLRKGAALQRGLLEAEGVSFTDRQRVDLKIYGWAGPDAEWLEDNKLVVPES